MVYKAFHMKTGGRDGLTSCGVWQTIIGKYIYKQYYQINEMIIYNIVKCQTMKLENQNSKKPVQGELLVNPERVASY